MTMRYAVLREVANRQTRQVKRHLPGRGSNKWTWLVCCRWTWWILYSLG